MCTCSREVWCYTPDAAKFFWLINNLTLPEAVQLVLDEMKWRRMAGLNVRRTLAMRSNE